ncbi:MAG TPA: wax ester/triacylglycerol synthase family O-acyltransferase [Acidimicrobiales bacterium]|nr:wax ester/triacylglycerol synthase family O-acyltransferase [Acidimicrobiales bacterium]
MEQPMRFERRMSDAESLMWSVEKDPSLRSSFLNLTLLDRPPHFERFRTRMERASVLIPRLRQRVAPEPIHLAPPMWEDDPAFDLDFHVQRTSLPRPGDERALLDLAASMYTDPFDRARPLWRFTVVEGLEDGRGALLAKMHHTITDGVGGVRLSAMFVDLEREVPDLEVPFLSPADDAGSSSFLNQVVDSLGHGVRRQLGISRRVVAGAVDLAAHPLRLPARASAAASAGQTLLRQALVSDHARSTLWRDKRSLGRRFEVLTVELDALKAAGKEVGGTVNDAFVAGVAGGVASYHRHHGHEVDELRMAMPVSTRSDRSAGGNAFTPTRVLVPAGIEDTRDRLTAVHQRLGEAKDDRAVALTDAFAQLLTGLPTAVLVRLAQAQVSTVDFAVSNVRGAPFDIYIAGAHVEANHPMGPTGGTACNVTTLSYKNNLDIGINVDTAAIPDANVFKECIQQSFAALIKLPIR